MLDTARSLLRSPDLAIDLGTANTRLFASGRGFLAETPSVIGNDRGEIHPLRRGVVVDIGGAAALLEPLIRRARSLRGAPRALVCIPTDATEDERRALRQATRAAGARQVAIVAEPLAAAIGAGLDIASPYAQMLVDIGDGVTDVAIIRSSSLVQTASLRLGCSDVRHVLAESMTTGGTMLRDDEADRLMRDVCSLPPDTACSWFPVKTAAGRMSVSSRDVAETIEPILEQLAAFVEAVVRDLPAAIGVEVIENGACVTGGGARLAALVDLLRERSGLRVFTADDPLHAVIAGAARIVTGPGARTLWNDAA